MDHIICIKNKEKVRVPFSHDVEALLNNFSSEFDIIPSDLVGFRHGQIVYPVSFVAKAGPKYFSTIPLEPIINYNYNKEKNSAIMEFKLAGGTESISIDRAFIQHLAWIRKRCGLQHTSVEDLHDVFDAAVEEEKEDDEEEDEYFEDSDDDSDDEEDNYKNFKNKRIIGKEMFEECMRLIIPVETLSEFDQKLLSQSLNRMFYAFDRLNVGKINADEFVSAFGALTTGSHRESKLKFAFQLFDENDDKFVSPIELLHFLRSFLTIILSLNDRMTTLPAQYVQDLVDSTSENVVHRVFHEADLNRDGKLSWEEFSYWYKTGGNTVLPWIQLLSIEVNDALNDEENSTANRKKKLLLIGNETLDDNKEFIDVNNQHNVDQIPIFEFPLSANVGNFKVTQNDIEVVEILLLGTKLNECDPVEVIQIFEHYSEQVGDGKLLTKNGFDKAMRDIINIARYLNPEEQQYLSYNLSNIFYAFDRDQTHEVLLDEFSAGFILLCQGSKSLKLSLAYNLFSSNTDEDESLTMIEFCRFLRSFLTVLFALNENIAMTPVDDIFKIIDLTVVDITKSVVKSMNLMDGMISFAEFGEFYNAGGHDLCGWLELLDLKKWPFDVDFFNTATVTASTTKNHRNRDPTILTSTINDSSNEDQSPLLNHVVFRFHLSSSVTLEINGIDVKNLGMILMTTDLDEISVEELQKKLLKKTKNGGLTKVAFDSVVREIVPAAYLSEEEKRFLNIALSNIYYAYDRDGESIVRIKEFASGFSLFCSGSKSDKLSLSWSLFDTDNDSFISKEQLARFLRSFLTVLFALSKEASANTADEVWLVVDETALKFADIIYNELDKPKHNALISFEEFASWYTEQGFEIAAWLELLDLSKWPMESLLQGKISSTPPTSYDSEDNIEFRKRYSDDHDDDNEEENPLDLNNHDDEEEYIFGFQLSSNELPLVIKQSDIDVLANLIRLTKFNEIEAETLMLAFLNDNYLDDGKLNKKNFDEIIRNLVPSSSLSKAEKVFLSKMLSRFFHAYDRNNTGEVEAVEIAAGFSIFGKGNKSEKLVLSYNLFQDDAHYDEDIVGGCLTRIGLWSYVKSFLVMLKAIVCEDIENYFVLIDDSAMEIAARIFLQSNHKNKDLVTFSDFASWYSQGGFSSAAWLELLSLSKWGLDLSPTTEEEEEEQLDSNEIIFQFILTNDQDTLDVREQDIKNLTRLIEITKLNEVEPEILLENMMDSSDSSTQISKNTFYQCIANLMKSTIDDLNVSESDQVFLNQKLNEIYISYVSSSSSASEENISTDVKLDELSCGLLLLSKGSKSEKLSLAYSMFDTYQTGRITQESLAKLLKSLLTILMALNNDIASIPLAEFHKITKEASQQSAQSIFDNAEREDEETLSFLDFSNWWSQGGYQSLPFLELLDLKKWK